MERLLETFPRVYAGVALSGLDIGRKNPLPHDQQGNRKPADISSSRLVDAETGDVVESDQKGRGYELKKGEYVEIKKERAGSRSDRKQPYHRHRQFRTQGRKSTSATSITPTTSRLTEKGRHRRLRRDPRRHEGSGSRRVGAHRPHQPEHIIAIEPLGKGLLGTTLRYPYELRDEDEYFADIKNPKISKDMIELASHILDTKAAHFDPGKSRTNTRTP